MTLWTWTEGLTCHGCVSACVMFVSRCEPVAHACVPADNHACACTMYCDRCRSRPRSHSESWPWIHRRWVRELATHCRMFPVTEPRARQCASAWWHWPHKPSGFARGDGVRQTTRVSATSAANAQPGAGARCRFRGVGGSACCYAAVRTRRPRSGSVGAVVITVGSAEQAHARPMPQANLALGSLEQQERHASRQQG